MKQKYALFYTFLLTLSAISLQVSAQSDAVPVPPQSKELILVTADSDSTASPLETLSGIHLQRVKKGKGDYQLNFQQELKENATLLITTKAGRKVYHKPINITDRKTAWSYNVGKLKPGIYNVQVKTSDTTYWTSFKIRK